MAQETLNQRAVVARMLLGGATMRGEGFLCSMVETPPVPYHPAWRQTPFRPPMVSVLGASHSATPIAFGVGQIVSEVRAVY